jgi:hypothetical protein
MLGTQPEPEGVDEEMAKTSKAGKAAGVASGAYASARSNEYVQRLIEDEELRGNLKDAYEAARNAYGRVTGNGKGPVKAVTKDKKVQRDLRSAADSLREASEQLRGGRKRKSRFGRVLIFGAVAGGVALAVSESARKAVMDTLFGAEEEFEYTSTTSGGGNSDGSSTGS